MKTLSQLAVRLGILALTAAVCLCDGAYAEEATSLDARITTAIDQALPFLAEDGRRWLYGEVPIQKGRDCVSCHQVPSGLWAQAVARRTLGKPSDDGFDEVFRDAVQFVSQPDTGSGASWGQILIASNAYGDNSKPALESAINDWRDVILNTQSDGGEWPAKGQFPSQRRSVKESDAVTTMWMLLGLKRWAGDVAMEDARKKALSFVDQIETPTSTEYLAMRAVVAGVIEGEIDNPHIESLLNRQQGDGSWSWEADSPGNAYSTGVALMALATAGPSTTRSRASVEDAANYLLALQQDDGSWEVSSELISKKPSPSRDYVYKYWGTAWAILGLSAAHDVLREPVRRAGG